ncbi:40S ribosomal protein S17-4 [Platanthera zijinensis]|uniref:40S ribosomal protein S17-4 n=1 Tax=Platanthera zijinensis TaxID=2320716 RepID=A0AAP0FYW7_9ASPA
MDFVPNESAIKIEEFKVDSDTLEMLTAISMANLPGVEKVDEAPAGSTFTGSPGYVNLGDTYFKVDGVDLKEQRGCLLVMLLFS